MTNPNEYIFFEPDQVLTNDHLNETFDYLDQQNRWTRNKLIGIGIVCGFDIVLSPGVIEITQGSGVTSQGYLIAQGTTDYKYYIPYTPADLPNDLPFTYTDTLPFYPVFCSGSSVWLLITDDQLNNLDATQKLTAIKLSTAANFLLDYAVVLFLEAKETELKNCNMLDCNNGGSNIVFTLRPLLVPIKDLPTVIADSDITTPAINTNLNLQQQVSLKRFNVPYTALNTTNDVLNAFVSLVDDATLTMLSTAYNNCFNNWGALLNVAPNPFANLLKTLQGYRNTVLTQNPIFIQYFYDLIDDLIKAYDEFSAKVSGIVGTCCPDENLFPLHLILGSASQGTGPFVQDSYRTYFMYSSLFSQMGNGMAGAMLLFNRMVIMVNKFTIPSQALQLQAALNITPSRYEFPPLSERAIPYYYQVNAPGAELYKYWNYYKTSHGNASLNLSYNSSLYSTNATVIKPLNYDIEKYNFFRIEGHIGQNYNTVLTNLLNQRLNYNLPFDVVAVSADQLQGNAPLPECSIQDLETDYNLIISEAACKIHLAFCFITKLPYKLFISTAKRKVPSSMFEVPKPSALKFSAFKLSAETIMPERINLTTAYKKGDFMRTYCPAVAGTIGFAYLESLSNGVFTNPVQVNGDIPLTGIYHSFFEFVNVVEEMMYVLNTNTLAQLDITEFNTAYEAYIADTLVALGLLIELTVALNSKSDASAVKQLVTLAEDTELDLLIDELGILTNICIEERLQVLTTEYTNRLTQYQQQLTFLNYYKNHPGLEHKAGVPKGGTFVMVYHSGAADTSVTTNTNANTASNAPSRRMEILKADTERADVASADTVPADLVTNADTISPALALMDDRSLNMIADFVNKCNDAPAATRNTIIGILNRLPPKRKSPAYSIPDGAIIADFYIPYLCCSDCPPVAYVMPGTVTPPHVTPVVKMATTFCVNDDKPAEVIVSPSGGTLNNVKGLVHGTKPTFTPKTAGAGVYNVVYTLPTGESSVPVEVTVLSMPVNTFSIEHKSVKRDPVLKGEILLINAIFMPDAIPGTQDNYTYEWTFGTGFPEKESTLRAPNLTIKYTPSEGTIRTEVSLLVKNSVANVNCNATRVTTTLFISGNGVFEETNANLGGLIKGIENLFTKKKKK